MESEHHFNIDFTLVVEIKYLTRSSFFPRLLRVTKSDKSFVFFFLTVEFIPEHLIDIYEQGEPYASGVNRGYHHHQVWSVMLLIYMAKIYKIYLKEEGKNYLTLM